MDFLNKKNITYTIIFIFIILSVMQLYKIKNNDIESFITLTENQLLGPNVNAIIQSTDNVQFTAIGTSSTPNSLSQILNSKVGLDGTNIFTGINRYTAPVIITGNLKYPEEEVRLWTNDGTGTFIIGCNSIPLSEGCLKIETGDWRTLGGEHTPSFSQIITKGRLRIIASEHLYLFGTQTTVRKEPSKGASGNLLVQGDLAVAGMTIHSYTDTTSMYCGVYATLQAGRVHIFSRTDDTYLISKRDTVVLKTDASAWGGASGNLKVMGNLRVDGTSSFGDMVRIGGIILEPSANYIQCTTGSSPVNNSPGCGSFSGLTTSWLRCNNVDVPSDRRLKENIKNISQNEKDKLLQLVPKTYTMIDDEKKTKRYGLIAQEVEEVYPELVSTGHDGMKSMNYIELIPLLLDQIKELKKSIPNPNLVNTNVLNIGGVTLTANELLKLKQLLN